MRKALFLLISVLIILACGGGGGGGGSVITPSTIVGRVLDITTGGPIAPNATVQVGSSSVQTLADGSFTLQVPQGTTNVQIDAGTYGVWQFTIPAADGTTDVGDLWVGPQRVTVTGRVIDAANGASVVGATVRFAGRTATTNSSGTFILQQVAYSNSSLAAFWGVKGTVNADKYFTTNFSAQPNTAVGGVVTVNDILLTRTSSDTPPPPPYNLFGTIAPSSAAPGTVVTLKLGTTPVRIYNVGTDGQFFFWVEPGDYTIEAVKGAQTGSASVTISEANQVVRKDVTLN